MFLARNPQFSSLEVLQSLGATMFEYLYTCVIAIPIQDHAGSTVGYTIYAAVDQRGIPYRGDRIAKQSIML